MINNNIQEDYCSFEVSKLLKEKGYRNDTFKYFIDVNDKHSNHRIISAKHLLGYDWNSYPSEENSSRVSSPTHALAIKWIRENFGYNIEVTWRNSDKVYISTAYPISPNTEVWLCGLHETFEKGTEAALLHTLKKLI